MIGYVPEHCVRVGSNPVRDADLQEQSPDEPTQSFSQIVVVHRPALLQLGQEFPGAVNRSGQDGRKEGNKRPESKSVPLCLDFPKVDVDGVTNQLEGEKTDADGHHDPECRLAVDAPQFFQQCGELFHKETEVLEIEKYPDSDDDTQRGQERGSFGRTIRISFDPDSQPIEDTGSYKKQRDHLPVGIAIEEPRCEQQPAVLPVCLTAEHGIVWQNDGCEENPENERVENH